jgi:hypothetical protein
VHQQPQRLRRSRACSCPQQLLRRLAPRLRLRQSSGRRSLMPGRSSGYVMIHHELVGSLNLSSLQRAADLTNRMAHKAGMYSSVADDVTAALEVCLQHCVRACAVAVRSRERRTTGLPHSRSGPVRVRHESASVLCKRCVACICTGLPLSRRVLTGRPPGPRLLRKACGELAFRFHASA